MLHLSNVLENNVLVGPPQCFIFVIICHLRGNHASLQEIKIVALEVQLNAEVDKKHQARTVHSGAEKIYASTIYERRMMKIVSP